MGCETKRQLLFIDECLKNKKEIRINSVYTFQTTEQIKKYMIIVLIKEFQDILLQIIQM